MHLPLLMKTALGALTLVASAPFVGASENWHPLFNGKDLSGWQSWLAQPPADAEVPGLTRDAQGKYSKNLGPDNDPLHVFQVQQTSDGPIIHITGQGTGGLQTLKSYSNYHLRLQFRWGKKKYQPRLDAVRDSGLLYHIHSDFAFGDSLWPSGLEMQIQEHDCGDLWMTRSKVNVHAHPQSEATAAIYDPTQPLIEIETGKGPNSKRCIKSADVEKPLGEWNTLELFCEDDRAEYRINGQVVMKLENISQQDGDHWKPLTAGRIALQLEAAEIDFRHIEIRKLKELPGANPLSPAWD